MKLLSDRIRYVLRENPDLEGRDGQLGLVKASGASKSVVNQWLTGDTKSMRIDFALNVERTMGYSHIWLMTGEGDPRETKIVFVSQSANDEGGAATDMAKIAVAYRDADEVQRRSLVDVADTILRELRDNNGLSAAN